jgi:hypothetical protein
LNLERFVISAVIALCPGLSRKGIWAIITGIKNDRFHEREIEFFDKRTLRRRKNEASVICAAVQERRAVLGLANTAEKVSATKKDKKNVIRSSCAILCFWTGNSNARPKGS